RAVAQAIGLRHTQEKYLYEREELSSLVNLVAEGQGLLPIGARLMQTAADAALRDRMARQARSAKDAEQAAVEARAANEELLEQVRVAQDEVQRLRAENMRLRAQLEAIHAGIDLRVAE